MLAIYKNTDGRFCELPPNELPPGSWLRLTAPTADELNRAAALAGLPPDCFNGSLENDNSPHIVKKQDALLVTIHIPAIGSHDSYTTTALQFILAPNCSITITALASPFLDAILQNANGRFDSPLPCRFLFQLLYHCGAEFLAQIQKIRQRTDAIEAVLRVAATNKEVYLLLNLEKGLTYFTAALRGNIIVVETIFRLSADPKLQQFLCLRREDEDLLESVILENKRALVMVETYSTILSSMMNAFSSVIANNLNHIMKFLASITIILSIPTVFSSFWSMSMIVPWQGTANGFWYVTVISLCASASAAYVLWKKKML